MFYQWTDGSLLDFLGFKLYKEISGLITAHHFEIFIDTEKSLHVAVLADRLSEDKYRFNYYFGIFEGKPISSGIETQEELNDLRKKLIAIKKPTNKIKARNLNNKLLGVLFEQGYSKSIENYYKKYFS